MENIVHEPEWLVPGQPVVRYTRASYLMPSPFLRETVIEYLTSRDIVLADGSRYRRNDVCAAATANGLGPLLPEVLWVYSAPRRLTGGIDGTLMHPDNPHIAQGRHDLAVHKAYEATRHAFEAWSADPEEATAAALHQALTDWSHAHATQMNGVV